MQKAEELEEAGGGGVKRPEGVELKYPQQLNCPGPAKGRAKKVRSRRSCTRYSERERDRKGKVSCQVLGTVKGN